MSTKPINLIDDLLLLEMIQDYDSSGSLSYDELVLELCARYRGLLDEYNELVDRFREHF